jgi:hypothetical protein
MLDSSGFRDEIGSFSRVCEELVGIYLPFPHGKDDPICKREVGQQIHL